MSCCEISSSSRRPRGPVTSARPRRSSGPFAETRAAHGGPQRRHAGVHQPALPPPLLQGLHRHGQPDARGARLALRPPGQARKDDRLQLAFDKLNTRPFVKLLEQYRPDDHRLHPLPARRDHLVADAEGEAGDPAGDRRHRLRRPRAVALPPTTRTTSSRSTRPAPTWRSWGSRPTRSRSPASRSTRSSPGRRTRPRCGPSTGCEPTGR